MYKKPSTVGLGIFDDNVLVDAGSASYMDVPVRFLCGSGIVNFHVLLILLLISHDDMEMFEVIAKLFDILASDWRIDLIDCTSGNARSMNG